jgi:Cysteine-rich secretory protein family
MSGIGLRCRLWAGCVAVLWSLSTSAALVDDLNGLRTKGCGKYSAAPNKLKQNRDLDAVAKEWAGGGRLAAAIKSTGYPATESASMRIEGSSNDSRILDMLAQNYCEQITGRDFTEIGVYRRDRNVWIVVAGRFTPPTTKDAARVGAEVLALVNEARAKPRRCGKTNFDAASPLTMSAMLTRAALIHAQDMSAHDHFEHEGTDGSSPSARISRVGYKWMTAAENIALGPTTAKQVVDGWLTSPGHCANIMDPRSTQMGLAYAVTGNGRDIYWAQDFASPQASSP